MNEKTKKGITSWAHLRFSVIGGLLSNPPGRGELQAELQKLAQKHYRHPFKEQWVTFGVSTIERWYYQALKSDDPISALTRKLRTDTGRNKRITPQLLKALKEQYQTWPNWSYQLHADNLRALTLERPELGECPSYSTVLRRMQKLGWIKKRLASRPKTAGQIKAAYKLENREVRSFESTHVHSMWHLDYHQGRKVVDAQGRWQTPKVLCILDDRSRLCCHIQWYLEETAENLIHGLTQAFHKRGLPRALMTDNGSAMLAGEVENGLKRLGIQHEKTLPYSPYFNGKQESFWGQLEGRLMAMLSHVEPLTLEFLNKATQAWAEQEYNRKIHEDTGQTPLERMLAGPDVSRKSVDAEVIHFNFTLFEMRTQRKSDGTLQIKGVRFEVPSHFRHIKRLKVAYKPFDLSMAYLVDPKLDLSMGRIYPQDKAKNAQGIRKTIEPVLEISADRPRQTEQVPPLLRKLLADYAATGLPPAYLPKEDPLYPNQENDIDLSNIF